MAGQGNPFSRDHSTGDSSESSLFPNPIPEEKGKEFLYPINNKVVRTPKFPKKLKFLYLQNIKVKQIN